MNQASKNRVMSGEETIDWQEHVFPCPYCGQETIVDSPMDTILMGRATCEHCGREFLIEKDVPRQLPQ